MKMLVRLASFLFSTVAFAAPGTHFSAPGPPAQVVEVCESGCRYTQICNATCTTATATCAAGTAIGDISDSAVTKPYIVKVAAGTYDECVAIKDKAYISLDLDQNAYVRSTSTAVTGGILRIAPSGNATDVNGVRIRGGVFHNDTKASEAGCQIGVEGGTGTAAEWDDLILDGVTCIGRNYGLVIEGSEVANASDVPTVTLKDVRSIARVNAVAIDGLVAADILGGTFKVWTNYCTTSAGVYGSSAVGATGNTTTAAHLASVPSGTTNSVGLMGRTLTLATGTCAAGATKTITSWNGSTLVAGWSGALGFTPDTTCTYTVSAPLMSDLAPCTDISWIDSGAGAIILGKNTGSYGLQLESSVDPNQSARVTMKGTVIDVFINEGATSGDKVAQVAHFGWPGEEITLDWDGRTVLGYSSPLGSGTLLNGFYIEQDGNDSAESVAISGRIQIRNDYDTNVDIYGATDSSGSPNATGNIIFNNLVFDVSAAVGSYTGNINDLTMADGAFANAYFGNVSTVQNNGRMRWVLAGSGEGITAPVKRFHAYQASISSLGYMHPNWSTNSAAWASGDLVCAKTNVPNGSGVITRASINVVTAAAAGKLCSVCTYLDDGKTPISLFQAFDSIACDATGEKNVATTSTSTNIVYAPGDYWICIGSDATATMVLKGLPDATRGTSVVGRLGTGAATCPATITPGSMTAFNTGVPEAVLLP